MKTVSDHIRELSEADRRIVLEGARRIRQNPVFRLVMDGLQADAIASRLRRVAIRCQTAVSNAYEHLTGRGFRVHWTDLRMTLPDAPETTTNGILMSNWEI